MKKVLTLATVCLFVLALCSCGSTDTPEGVTTKAIKCLIDKDYPRVAAHEAEARVHHQGQGRAGEDKGKFDKHVGGRLVVKELVEKFGFVKVEVLI